MRTHFLEPARERNGKIILSVLVVLGSVISGCGKYKEGVPESTAVHIFAACEGYLKTRAVAYDEADKRSLAYFNSGDKKQGCEFRRRALGAVNDAIQSFATGECRSFHEVANDYISWKVGNLQKRFTAKKTATEDALKREC